MKKLTTELAALRRKENRPSAKKLLNEYIRKEQIGLVKKQTYSLPNNMQLSQGFFTSSINENY